MDAFYNAVVFIFQQFVMPRTVILLNLTYITGAQAGRVRLVRTRNFPKGPLVTQKAIPFLSGVTLKSLCWIKSTILKLEVPVCATSYLRYKASYMLHLKNIFYFKYFIFQVSLKCLSGLTLFFQIFYTKTDKGESAPQESWPLCQAPADSDVTRLAKEIRWPVGKSKSAHSLCETMI